MQFFFFTQLLGWDKNSTAVMNPYASALHCKAFLDLHPYFFAGTELILLGENGFKKSLDESYGNPFTNS